MSSLYFTKPSIRKEDGIFPRMNLRACVNKKAFSGKDFRVSVFYLTFVVRAKNVNLRSTMFPPKK
jgi:hypothetical protein